MNQVPVETSQSNNAVPAPVKAEKLQDQPEVDHDDSERTGSSGNQFRFDGLSDEPMVKYDDFGSVGKPFLPLFDEDEDVVNAQSPIICKLSASRSATSSPNCVKDHEPSWTIQEFQEYLGMLELLQDVCSNSDGDEMCLSSASLGKMERLLTSLLPQGV